MPLFRHKTTASGLKHQHCFYALLRRNQQRPLNLFEKLILAQAQQTAHAATRKEQPEVSSLYSIIGQCPEAATNLCGDDHIHQQLNYYK